MATTIDGTPIVLPLCKSDVAEYLASDFAEQVAGGTNVMLYADSVSFDAWGNLLHALMTRSREDRRFKVIIHGGTVTILHPAQNLAVT